eukprot:TRINITY_DN19526_c0_g1_i1.p1 TRINITY_DN19526_c0_g1~~TRINITY_DN19526_c0_g1_i1.p1  ORF type:complete len:261 (-),score=39.67 TRINITY_DN19526_c0_g1_i1:139-840(-)
MSFSTNFAGPVNWSAVGKFHDIGPHIRAHVINVYVTLAATVLAGALGSLLYLSYHVGGTWSSLGGFALLIWLSSVPQEDVSKRTSILAGFGVLQGLSVGPLLEAVIDIDPKIVVTAFLGTVVVFGCFSASALYARRRSYLYLGGMLSSGLSLLLTLSLLNIFFRSTTAANVSIYLGLMLFCGFIIFDTQLMIERCDQGNADFVWDALNLFLDFVSIFVRLLIILSKKNEKRRN